MYTGQYDYQMLQALNNILQQVQNILKSLNDLFLFIQQYLPYVIILLSFILFIYVGFRSIRRYKVC